MIVTYATKTLTALLTLNPPTIGHSKHLTYLHNMDSPYPRLIEIGKKRSLSEKSFLLLNKPSLTKIKENPITYDVEIVVLNPLHLALVANRRNFAPLLSSLKHLAPTAQYNALAYRNQTSHNVLFASSRIPGLIEYDAIIHFLRLWPAGMHVDLERLVHDKDKDGYHLLSRELYRGTELHLTRLCISFEKLPDVLTEFFANLSWIRNAINPLMPKNTHFMFYALNWLGKGFSLKQKEPLLLLVKHVICHAPDYYDTLFRALTLFSPELRNDIIMNIFDELAAIIPPHGDTFFISLMENADVFERVCDFLIGSRQPARVIDLLRKNMRLPQRLTSTHPSIDSLFKLIATLPIGEQQALMTHTNLNGRSIVNFKLGKKSEQKLVSYVNIIRNKHQLLFFENPEAKPIKQVSPPLRPISCPPLPIESDIKNSL